LTTPIHWAKAVNFPETATHAVDFGPGGLSGIGPLTSRLLEGRGVSVVVVGDKSKGPADLYNVNVVKYEEAWAKKFAPRLVKTRYNELLFEHYMRSLHSI
jgi:fatty acid synthase subunit alpha